MTNTKTSRDTNKYVVATGFAGDGDGDIVLAKPGNQVAWVNNDPVAVGNSYTGNFAFERNAIHLLTRVPKMPKEGAMGEHTIITDPFSGISFLLSIYPAYHKEGHNGFALDSLDAPCNGQFNDHLVVSGIQ